MSFSDFGSFDFVRLKHLAPLRPFCRFDLQITASHTTACNDLASQPAPTTAVASHSIASKASASHTSPITASASHTTAPAISTQHDAHLEVGNNIVTISRATIHDDTIGEPWIVNNKDVGTFFKRYQQAIYDVLDQHTTLPLESYIQKLADLTHIFIVCKNQHSTIAEKIFSLDLLKKLVDTFALKYVWSFQSPCKHSKSYG